MTGATLFAREHTSEKSISQPSTAHAEPKFVLEITRGRTQHPERPCFDDRFLIGAGDGCDLRLGGNGIPPLHSVIHMDDDGMMIDAISPTPVLRVNGEAVRSAHLHPGDIIDLGNHEFAVRSIHQEQTGENDSHALTDDDENEMPDLEQLSASELVDLIEQEEMELSQRIGRSELGAAGLLFELQRRADTLANERSSHETEDFELRELSEAPSILTGDQEGELLGEIERIITELDTFSHHLDERASHFSEQEEMFTRSTMTLLDVQHRVTEQLESLLERVTSLQQEAQSTRPLRHSA